MLNPASPATELVPTETAATELAADESAPTLAARPFAHRTDHVAVLHAVPIRLRRPPASEPPFDGGSSAASTNRTVTEPVAGRVSTVAPPVAGESVRRRTAAHELPSAAVSAQRYVRTCLEVLNGFRPAAHLRTLAGPVEFGSVVNQLSRRRNGRGHFAQVTTVAPGRVGGSRGAASNVPADPPAPTVPVRHAVNLGQTALGRSPVASARRNAPGAAQPFRLTRMRISEPRDGVAEVVAVLSYAGSSLAVAMRLERHDAHWLCALVQVI
jgi:hypothetical protein